MDLIILGMSIFSLGVAASALIIIRGVKKNQLYEQEAARIHAGAVKGVMDELRPLIKHLNECQRQDCDICDVTMLNLCALVGMERL